MKVARMYVKERLSGRLALPLRNIMILMAS